MDPSKLTSIQQEKLQQFRKGIQDVLQEKHDNYFLTRWLIARSWDIPKAEKMIRTSFDWRARTKMDTILEDWTAPEVLHSYVPGGFFGFDKGGSPIYLEPIGRADMKGVLRSASLRDMLKYQLQRMEVGENLIRQKKQEMGVYPGGLTVIYDFEYFGLKHMWEPGLELICEVFQHAESNHPELLKAAFIINAPTLFHIAYNFVRPFLHEATRAKVHVLGQNWKEKLLEAIDNDQLPIQWGGTQGDSSDPFCSSKICMGGQVPESYYKEELSVAEDTLEKVTVCRSSKLDVELNVSEGSTIRWQFKTINYDIRFGIFFAPSCSSKEEPKEVAVVEPQRLLSHMVPEDDSVVVDKAGTYIVRFDNSYSWLHSKKLLYKVLVLPPQEQT